MELRPAGNRAAEQTGASDSGPSAAAGAAPAVSRQDLDTAATDLAVKQAQIGTIEAQIKRNRATLDTAKTNLDYTRIWRRWPASDANYHPAGTTVIAAQQAPNILTLADLSTMLVKAQVSGRMSSTSDRGKSVVYRAGRPAYPL